MKEGRPNQGWLYSTMVKKRTLYHYAVRKLKRKADLVQAKKLFEASMQGDLNLLKEMKTIRGGKMEHRELPETVAGANGEEEVVEKFREVYSTLYNSAESEKEMEDLMTKVLSQIIGDSDGEVGKMTAAKVKEAAGGGAVTFVSLVFFMFQSILNIFVLFCFFLVAKINYFHG